MTSTTTTKNPFTSQQEIVDLTLSQSPYRHSPINPKHLPHFISTTNASTYTRILPIQKTDTTPKDFMVDNSDEAEEVC
jgi:hypothetical protein